VLCRAFLFLSLFVLRHSTTHDAIGIGYMSEQASEEAAGGAHVRKPTGVN